MNEALNLDIWNRQPHCEYTTTTTSV